MHCAFPSCNYDVCRDFSQEITLYRFPEEEPLRTAWLEALGKEDWDLEPDCGVCSRHFLTEDFLVTRNGRKLRADAVPVDNVQVCRICFASDCKLYPIKDNRQFDLARPSYAFAYETLTGLTIEQDDKLPPYLCIKCANRLLNCVRFKARSIRAHSILLEIVNDYGYITLESILSASRSQNPFCSDVTYNHTESEYTDSESTGTGKQYLKQEDITIDSFEVGNDVFDQNIIITDVRSTNDKRQDSAGTIVAVVKAENVDMINNILNNEVVDKETMCSSELKLSSLQDDTVIDHDKAENKEAIDSIKVNEGTDNDGAHVEGEDYSMKERLSSRTPRQNDKASSARVKHVTTASKDLKQTKVNRYGKPKGNGGLLLTYKLLSCDICYYQTVSKVQLMHHLKVHSNKLYNCNKCYFLTDSKKSLLFHIAIHTDRKRYVCDVCKKTFYYKIDLRSHLLIHSGEKPFSCDICSKKFTQNNHLNAHLRIHSGEKPYSCKVCNKAFRQKGHLKNHMQIHSGEKPYTCDLCNKGFIQRGQLQNHFRKHSGEKPYSCDFCNKAFIQKGHLQNHLRIHSGDKP